MWARIEQSKVAEMTDIDPGGRFHPELLWIECESSVNYGWLYNGSSFSPPNPDDDE